MSADRSNHHDSRSMHGDSLSKYLRFVAMIATSTVVIYLLTDTNVFAIEHIHADLNA